VKIVAFPFKQCETQCFPYCNICEINVSLCLISAAVKTVTAFLNVHFLVFITFIGFNLHYQIVCKISLPVAYCDLLLCLYCRVV
jgi:hypothetical protein